MEGTSKEAIFSWVLNEKEDPATQIAGEIGSRQREQQAQNPWDGSKLVVFEEEKVEHSGWSLEMGRGQWYEMK